MFLSQTINFPLHYTGSHSECQYKLMSFGIDVKDFPISMNGEYKLANHMKWVERRKKKEKFLRTNCLPDGAVDLPSKLDVLLGRGSPFNAHPGNKRLHEMVSLRFVEYDNTPRAEKTRIAVEIVGDVHKSSGCFLKQDDESGMWVKVSNLEARNNVSHCFRRKRELDLKVH